MVMLQLCRWKSSHK